MYIGNKCKRVSHFDAKCTKLELVPTTQCSIQRVSAVAHTAACHQLQVCLFLEAAAWLTLPAALRRWTFVIPTTITRLPASFVETFAWSIIVVSLAARLHADAAPILHAWCSARHGCLLLAACLTRVDQQLWVQALSARCGAVSDIWLWCSTGCARWTSTQGASSCSGCRQGPGLHAVAQPVLSVTKPVVAAQSA